MKAPGQILAPGGRTITEKIRNAIEADSVLTAGGSKVLARSKRNHNRNEQRREIKIQKHFNDETLRATTGATDALPQWSRVKVTDVPRGYEIPCSPGPEKALLQKEHERLMIEGVAALIGRVFKDDSEVRAVLFAVIKPPGISDSDNKALAQETGLSVPQVEAAKARLRYRAAKRNDPIMEEIRQLLRQGGQI